MQEEFTETIKSASTGKPNRFRRFFFRGLGILLPTALTIWLVVIAYQFVHDYIGKPINEGVKQGIINFTDWPAATFDEAEVRAQALQKMDDAWKQQFEAADVKTRLEMLKTYDLDQLSRDVLAEMTSSERSRFQNLSGEAKQKLLIRWSRRDRLDAFWGDYWYVFDLIGIIIAIIAVYILGAVVGSYIGNRAHRKAENLIARVPLISRVYPSVKQVTDFFFDSDGKNKMQFSRVVAVEYPRKGLWSVGLLTGTTMRTIQQAADADCLTVFVPSSPTPFTGYVITVPRKDTIDLPVTLEEALKFTISGGVLVPPNERVDLPVGPVDGNSSNAAAVLTTQPQPTTHHSTASKENHAD